MPLLALTVENVNGKCFSGAQLFSLAQTFFILHVFHVARPIFLKLCRFFIIGGTVKSSRVRP